MIKRVLASIGLAATAAAVSLIPGGTAQANDWPDYVAVRDYRWSSSCPCSLSDSWDGTQFAKDTGGRALKVKVYSKKATGPLAGKVEFHPQGEHLYVYDTLKDGYGITATVQVNDGTVHSYKSRSQGHNFYNLDIDENDTVTIKVYQTKNPLWRIVNKGDKGPYYAYA